MSLNCEYCETPLSKDELDEYCLCNKCWELGFYKVYKTSNRMLDDSWEHGHYRVHKTSASWHWYNLGRYIYLQDCVYALEVSFLSPNKLLKLKRYIVLDLEGTYWELLDIEPQGCGEEVKTRAKRIDRERATLILIEYLQKKDNCELEYDLQFFNVFDEPQAGLKELKKRGYSHYHIEPGYYTPWDYYYVLYKRGEHLYWEATIYYEYEHSLNKWLIKKVGPHKVENTDNIKLI